MSVAAQIIQTVRRHENRNIVTLEIAKRMDSTALDSRQILAIIRQEMGEHQSTMIMLKFFEKMEANFTKGFLSQRKTNAAFVSKELE